MTNSSQLPASKGNFTQASVLTGLDSAPQPLLVWTTTKMPSKPLDTSGENALTAGAPVPTICLPVPSPYREKQSLFLWDWRRTLACLRSEPCPYFNSLWNVVNQDNRPKMESLTLSPTSPNLDLNVVTVFGLSQKWNKKPVRRELPGQHW